MSTLAYFLFPVIVCVFGVAAEESELFRCWEQHTEDLYALSMDKFEFCSYIPSSKSEDIFSVSGATAKMPLFAAVQEVFEEYKDKEATALCYQEEKPSGNPLKRNEEIILCFCRGNGCNAPKKFTEFLNSIRTPAVITVDYPDHIKKNGAIFIFTKHY